MSEAVTAKKFLSTEEPKQAASQSTSFSFSAEGLDKLSLYLSQAIMLEVCVHPKPGLVTRCSRGAHTDMTILTFAASSAVLAHAFKNLYELGLAFPRGPRQLFAKARALGAEAEKELLRATKGVNTQRGILFSGGILCAAAGHCLRDEREKRELLATVRAMTKGLTERELQEGKKSKTAGELLFQRYGIKGIRGEIEAGLPCVTGRGLPALEEAFAAGADLNDALVHAFVCLMAVTEDSNVIWRAGLEGARQVKEQAEKILSAGSVFTAKGRAALAEAEDIFAARRISPGGSADLLSVTIALYLLKHKEFPTAIL